MLVYVSLMVTEMYVALMVTELLMDQLNLPFYCVQDALRTFLLRKLDNLAKDDTCQITMISTWITELYLDKVHAL